MERTSKRAKKRERDLYWSTVESLKNARSIFSHFFTKSFVFVFRVLFLLDGWFVNAITVSPMWEKKQQQKRMKNQYKNEKLNQNLKGRVYLVFSSKCWRFYMGFWDHVQSCLNWILTKSKLERKKFIQTFKFIGRFECLNFQ